jgi:hypothetical protein
MKSIIIKILILLTLTSCSEKVPQTVELTYVNGDKEVFNTTSYSYNRPELDMNGCVVISHSIKVCGVRRVRYLDN